MYARGGQCMQVVVSVYRRWSMYAGGGQCMQEVVNVCRRWSRWSMYAGGGQCMQEVVNVCTLHLFQRLKSNAYETELETNTEKVTSDTCVHISAVGHTTICVISEFI